MIHLKRTVIEAYAPFFDITPPLVPFRDAAFSTCTFPLTVLQVIKTLARQDGTLVKQLVTFP